MRFPEAARFLPGRLFLRIELILSLPMESIDEMSLKTRLRWIPGGADTDQHAA